MQVILTETGTEITTLIPVFTCRCCQHLTEFHMWYNCINSWSKHTRTCSSPDTLIFMSLSLHFFSDTQAITILLGLHRKMLSHSDVSIHYFKRKYYRCQIFICCSFKIKVSNTHYFYLLCSCKSDSSLSINISGIFLARITWSRDYHTGSNLFLSRRFQGIRYGLKLHDFYKGCGKLFDRHGMLPCWYKPCCFFLLILYRFYTGLKWQRNN